MDKRDSKKSLFDRIKYLWNSLPEFVRFIGTLLGIAIAVKALLPAVAMQINYFGASPDVIEPGDSSILSWEVSRASSVTIEPDIGAVSSNGSLSVSPPQTTTYKLVISGKGENKTASCTITVKKSSPLITSFTASPNSVKAGESTVLNWHVAGASNVTIEPDIGVSEPTGTTSVSPAKTTTYKLSASNDDKKDMAYCTITVEDNLTSPKDDLVSPTDNLTSPKEDQTNPQRSLPSSQVNNPTPPQSNLTSPTTSSTPQGSLPTINTFNANPDMISKGESSNLTWSVSSATKVSIEPGIGTVGLTGSQRMFPDQNTTYTLTAINEFGSIDATKTVYIQKLPESTSATQVSSKTFPTPKQLLPANGTVFDNSTSGTTLVWTAVTGAANYMVEIDAYDSDSNSWLSESAGSSVIPGITATSYSFEFPAKGSGRWRVWAVGPNGEESKKSGWWYFNTT